MSRPVRPARRGDLILRIPDIGKTALIRDSMIEDTEYNLNTKSTQEAFTNKTITDLSNDVSAKRLTSDGVIYSISGTPTVGQVLTNTGPTTLEWAAAGGASFPTTTKGDLLACDGTAGTVVRLPVGGLNGQMLTVDSATATGLRYSSVLLNGTVDTATTNFGDYSLTGTRSAVMNFAAATNGTSSELSFTATADRTYTFPDSSGTLALTSQLSGFVDLTSVQTASNKTLSGPKLTALPTDNASTPLGFSAGGGGAIALVTDLVNLASTQILSNKSFYDSLTITPSPPFAGAIGQLVIADTGCGTGTVVTLQGGGNVGNITVSLPASTGTLALTSQLSGFVDLSSLQTLTNKTLTTADNSIIVSAVPVPTSLNLLMNQDVRNTASPIFNALTLGPTISVQDVTISKTGPGTSLFNIEGAGTVTMKDGVYDLVGTSIGQTLTNKTINSASNTITITSGPYVATNINTVVDKKYAALSQGNILGASSVNMVFPATPYPFTGWVSDQLNGFTSPSDGVLQCPATGLYRVWYRITLSGAVTDTQHTLLVFLNGVVPTAVSTRLTSVFYTDNLGNGTGFADAIVSLTAGDQIDVRIEAGAAALATVVTKCFCAIGI